MRGHLVAIALLLPGLAVAAPRAATREEAARFRDGIKALREKGQPRGSQIEGQIAFVLPDGAMVGGIHYRVGLHARAGSERVREGSDEVAAVLEPNGALRWRQVSKDHDAARQLTMMAPLDDGSILVVSRLHTHPFYGWVGEPAARPRWLLLDVWPDGTPRWRAKAYTKQAPRLTDRGTIRFFGEPLRGGEAPVFEVRLDGGLVGDPAHVVGSSPALDVERD